MSFLVLGVMLLVSTAVSIGAQMLINNRNNGGTGSSSSESSGFSDDAIPTVENGSIMNVVFGTRVITDPMIVYSGNYDTIDEGSKEDGYVIHYLLDAHLICCLGRADSINRIYSDSKLAWSPSIDQKPLKNFEFWGGGSISSEAYISSTGFRFPAYLDVANIRGYLGKTSGYDYEGLQYFDKHMSETDSTRMHYLLAEDFGVHARESYLDNEVIEEIIESGSYKTNYNDYKIACVAMTLLFLVGGNNDKIRNRILTVMNEHSFDKSMNFGFIRTTYGVTTLHTKHGGAATFVYAIRPDVLTAEVPLDYYASLLFHYPEKTHANPTTAVYGYRLVSVVGQTKTRAAIYNNGAYKSKYGNYLGLIGLDGNGVTENSKFEIIQADFYGGRRSGGHLFSNIFAMFGDRDDNFTMFKSAAKYRNRVLYANSPVGDFRDFTSEMLGYTGLYFSDTVVGTSPTMRKLSVELTRIKRKLTNEEQWYPEKVTVLGNCMNPVHIIREILTSQHPKFGIGVLESQINDNNFKEVADLLYEENIGLSYVLTNNFTAEELLNDIFEVINGLLRRNIQTGLYEIVLHRADSKVNKHTIENEDFIEFVEVSYNENNNVNTVIIEYWDYALNKTNKLYFTVERDGFYTQIEKTTKLEGCTNQNLAETVGNRKLREYIAKPTMIKIKVLHLTNNNYNLGDKLTLKIHNLDYKLVSNDYIITDVEYAEDMSYVVLHCIENIFEDYSIDEVIENLNVEQPIKTLAVKYEDLVDPIILNIGNKLVVLINDYKETLGDNLTCYFGEKDITLHKARVTAITSLSEEDVENIPTTVFSNLTRGITHLYHLESGEIIDVSGIEIIRGVNDTTISSINSGDVLIGFNLNSFVEHDGLEKDLYLPYRVGKITYV